MMKGLEEDLKAKGVDVKKGAGDDLDVSLPPTLYDDSTTLVVLHFDDETSTVRSYTVMVEYEGNPAAKDEILAATTQAWGEPKTLKKTLGESPFWYDAENGLRASARVEDDEIQFEYVTYMPLKTFFGEGKDKFGFETTAILSASAEDLQKAFGASCKIKEDKKFGSLHLSRTDYDDNVGGTLVHLVFGDDGKIKSYSFSLEYEDYAGAKEEFLGMLKGKFGEPKEAPKDYRKRQMYSESPKVLVHDSDITDSLDVEVSAK